MKKRFAAALLAALMLLSLAGCASWDPGTYSNDPMSELYDYYQPDAPEETPALTAFVLPCLSGVTLDPITCPDGIQLTVAALLYEPLYRLTPQFETENVLAQSESYDVETFTYTIRLRSGVRFSDGTALTAQDVAATLLRAQQSPRYAARLTDVVSVTAAGSDAVTIQLAQDRRSFTSLLDIPIVKSGTEASATPTGTGPYAREDDTLRQNTFWWRTADLPFSEIGLLSYKSEEAAAYAFSSHDVQLLACDLTSANGSIASTSGSYTDADTTILQFLGFNMSRKLFQDENMRQAIGMAVDRAAIVSAYLMGHGAATQFPVHPASELYPRSLESTYNAAGCAAAMAELNMADGEGVYDLTLLVNSENSCKVAAAQEIAQALNQYDFNVTVRALDWDEYLTALSEGRFDLYYGECKLTADWDVSALLATGGSLNYGGWADPILDTHLAACLTAKDTYSRSTALETLCRRLRSQTPIVPICFKRTSVLLPNNAVDAITPTAADPFYQLENWHVNWDTADTKTDTKK